MINSTSIRVRSRLRRRKGGRSLSRSITRWAHDQDRRRLRTRHPDPARSDAQRAQDGPVAGRLLNHFGPRTIVLSDKAYDANRIGEMIKQPTPHPTSCRSAVGNGGRASASGSAVSGT